VQVHPDRDIHAGMPGAQHPHGETGAQILSCQSQVPTLEAALRFKHIVDTSAAQVDVGGGRTALLNHTWCGWPFRRDLGMRGAHPYGGYERVIDCPDCKHVARCGESCQHLDGSA